MIKPSRRNVTPVIVRDPKASGASQIEPLERIPLSRHELDEGWLQQLIFEHPSLLAVEEIEPDYGPLIPLARELPNNAGYMDALYVSPDGLLTLVEAKLWRNPMARREVVGQILDYAKQLRSWTYGELDKRVKNATTTGVWEAVQRAGHGSELDESEFVDAVARNLRRGRFLLLIVGDGIQESVEELAEFLQGTPDMRFTLALVELGLYRSVGNEDIVVVPSVVARTREIVRAVVDISDTAMENAVTASDAMPIEGDGPTPRTPIDDDAFYGFMLREAGEDAVRWARTFFAQVERRAVRIHSGSSNKMVKLRDPAGSGVDLTLCGIDRRGTFWIGWLGSQMVRAGWEFEGGAGERYIQALSELFGKTATPRDRPHNEFWAQPVALDETTVTPEEALTVIDHFLDQLATEVQARR